MLLVVISGFISAQLLVSDPISAWLASRTVFSAVFVAVCAAGLGVSFSSVVLLFLSFNCHAMLLLLFAQVDGRHIIISADESVCQLDVGHLGVVVVHGYLFLIVGW